jgi:hypothetical protein
MTSPSSVQAVTSKTGRWRAVVDEQGMVAADLERVGQALEEPLAVVVDHGRLAVHDPLGPADLGTGEPPQELVPEADPEDRRPFRQGLEELPAQAGVSGMARAGGDDRAFEPGMLGEFEDLGLIVSPDQDLSTQLLEHLNQVESKRVKVVDYQYHRRLRDS